MFKQQITIRELYVLTPRSAGLVPYRFRHILLPKIYDGIIPSRAMKLELKRHHLNLRGRPLNINMGRRVTYFHKQVTH